MKYQAFSTCCIPREISEGIDDIRPRMEDKLVAMYFLDSGSTLQDSCIKKFDFKKA